MLNFPDPDDEEEFDDDSDIEEDSDIECEEGDCND